MEVWLMTDPMFWVTLGAWSGFCTGLFTGAFLQNEPQARVRRLGFSYVALGVGAEGQGCRGMGWPLSLSPSATVN
jgi:hypothetical protein